MITFEQAYPLFVVISIHVLIWTGITTMALLVCKIIRPSLLGMIELALLLAAINYGFGMQDGRVLFACMLAELIMTAQVCFAAWRRFFALRQRKPQWPRITIIGGPDNLRLP